MFSYARFQIVWGLSLLVLGAALALICDNGRFGAVSAIRLGFFGQSGGYARHCAPASLSIDA